MDRKSFKLIHFLPQTPLRSHVSHTYMLRRTHTPPEQLQENPNVLISVDKQRQGDSIEEAPISKLIVKLLSLHFWTLKVLLSSSSFRTRPECPRMNSDLTKSNSQHKKEKVIVKRTLSYYCSYIQPTSNYIYKYTIVWVMFKNVDWLQRSMINFWFITVNHYIMIQLLLHRCPVNNQNKMLHFLTALKQITANHWNHFGQVF